jgi:hypothetical protein
MDLHAKGLERESRIRERLTEAVDEMTEEIGGYEGHEDE